MSLAKADIKVGLYALCVVTFVVAGLQAGQATGRTRRLQRNRKVPREA